MTTCQFFMNKVWDIYSCDFYFLLNIFFWRFYSKCLFVCLFVGADKIIPNRTCNAVPEKMSGLQESCWKLFNAFPFFTLYPAVCSAGLTLHIVCWTHSTHNTAHIILHTLKSSRALDNVYCAVYTLQVPRAHWTVQTANWILHLHSPVNQLLIAAAKYTEDFQYLWELVIGAFHWNIELWVY